MVGAMRWWVHPFFCISTPASKWDQARSNHRSSKDHHTTHLVSAMNRIISHCHRFPFTQVPDLQHGREASCSKITTRGKANVVKVSSKTLGNHLQLMIFESFHFASSCILFSSSPTHTAHTIGQCLLFGHHITDVAWVDCHC